MNLRNIKHLLAISLPIIIIGVCIFWIVRLELKAAALTSRVDDLHNSLKQNKDELANLESFWREVNKSGITIDKNGGMLYRGDSKIYWDEKTILLVNKDKEMGFEEYRNGIFMRNKKDNIYLSMGDIKGTGSTGLRPGIILSVGPGINKVSSFLLTKDNIRLSTSEENEVSIEIAGTKKSRVHITKEGVKIEAGKNNDFFVNLSHDRNRIELVKGKSMIYMGEASYTKSSGGTTKENGVFISESSIGSIAIVKDKGIGISNIDDNGITISTGKGKDFYIKLKPKVNQIKMKKGESEIQMGQSKYGEGLIFKNKDNQIQVGQTAFGDGILLGDKETATLSIVKGKGIAIRTEGPGNIMKISGDDKLVITFKGDIDINAMGDLNLNSLNGNVNLVGKRINFNE